MLSPSLTHALRSLQTRYSAAAAACSCSRPVTPDATSLRAFVNMRMPVPAVDAVRAIARALVDMSSICFIFEVSMPRSMAVDCFIFLRGGGVRSSGSGSLGVRQPSFRRRSGRRGEDASTARAGRFGSSGSVVPRVQAVTKRVAQRTLQVATTNAGFVASCGMSPRAVLFRLGRRCLEGEVIGRQCC